MQAQTLLTQAELTFIRQLHQPSRAEPARSDQVSFRQKKTHTQCGPKKQENILQQG